MGVPSVALCVSKKHEELMKQLAARQLIEYAGPWSDVTSHKLAATY